MESTKLCSTSPSTQQDRETEVFQTCARAGVSCIGIQSGFGTKPDLVLFQQPSTTLAIPLSEFTNPDKAIELIKAKLAELGNISRDFVELLVVAALALSIGLALGAVLCVGR